MGAASMPVPGMISWPKLFISATFKPAGAGPWPQMACCCPVRALWNKIGQSPPGPFKCGSTICSVKPAAAAASKALPPRSNTAIPTWEAIQCVEATAPKVPMISGRVVKPRAPSFAGKPMEARVVWDMGAFVPSFRRARDAARLCFSRRNGQKDKIRCANRPPSFISRAPKTCLIAFSESPSFSLGLKMLRPQPDRHRVRRAFRQRRPWPRSLLPAPRAGRYSRKDASALQ